MLTAAFPNSSKLETTQICTKRRMDKYIGIYSYNGIWHLMEYGNKITIVIYSNTDESHIHNTEQVKPNTKEYRPWLYLYEVQGQTKLIYGDGSQNYFWEGYWLEGYWLEGITRESSGRLEIPWSRWWLHTCVHMQNYIEPYT